MFESLKFETYIRESLKVWMFENQFKLWKFESLKVWKVESLKVWKFGSLKANPLPPVNPRAGGPPLSLPGSHPFPAVTLEPSLPRFKPSNFQTFKLFKLSNFETLQTFKLSNFQTFKDWKTWWLSPAPKNQSLKVWSLKVWKFEGLKVWKVENLKFSYRV